MVQATIYSPDLIGVAGKANRLSRDIKSSDIVDGIEEDGKFNTYTKNLLSEVNTVIDQNDEKYFNGEDGNNNLHIDPSENYYSNQKGDHADKKIKKQMHQLNKIRKAMGDDNGQWDVTELKMKSNRFHYFTFFFTFIIIIIYTMKVFTNSKNNTVETLILIVASLIVLYYLVNFIMEYLRKRH